MIFKIKDKYYFKRNRKFIRVDVTFKNDVPIIKANHNDIIEDNGDIKYYEVSLDNIREELSKKQENKELNKIK